MDKVQTISRRAAIIGALASSSALGTAVAATADSPTSTISLLFPDWLALRNERDVPAEEWPAHFARYVELQERITAASPANVREAAIQLVVETDDGDSDYRDEFYARLRALAMGEARI
ncbi:hypothetical protein [Devosia sp. CN2-171]|uniref:hypothetical protein n=1 Tax=Devosia sp. CN2-171 TaxID=3400909 RepID=UPI003BF81AA4